MSVAEREEFIARIDRALPGAVVERLTEAVAQRFGDEQPELAGQMSEADPGRRLQVMAEALVENSARRAADNGMQYVPDEVSRSAEVEFTSLEMARALQEPAEHGMQPLFADGKYFADRALNAGGLAVTGITMHDIRGGLDSSGRLPGPQYPAPDNPAPDWVQEKIEGLAAEYGSVLADHRSQYAAMEAMRHSGIGIGNAAPAAKGVSGDAAKAVSGDGARSGHRTVKTRPTGPHLGSN
ncbi:hypothetical protein [Kribbella sp. C-35]|uniref:hypothetical protein n=1 Tax=Kribbella sp. C-35 TaxID=2789276 RepID=UPI00397C269E